MKLHTYNPFRSVAGLLLLSLLVWQCGRNSQDTGVLPAPVPAFATTISPLNPLRVSFANTSGQARTFFWNFGDGTGTSQLATPTYTYRRAGTYRVRLVASGDGGAANVVQNVVITAPPEPVANFTVAINDAVTPLRVAFTNTTTNGASYSWDFGVSNVASDTSNVLNPSFDFPQSGLYTVRLTARSLANIFTNVKQFNVLVIRPADLAGTAAAGRTWLYDRTRGLSFDDGGSFSSQKSCELNDEFTFFPDLRYATDNKGDEIKFPDCVSVAARPVTTWALSRTAPDRFSLTIGSGSYLGDPTTNLTYVITNLTPTSLAITAAFGFGPANYRMVPK